MKQIVLERNVDYAVWENLIYMLVVLTAIFLGVTFTKTGDIAILTSVISGILIIICSLALVVKKGLVFRQELYRGHFLFGKLLFKKKIENSISDNFTLLVKKYRQKYIGGRRDPNLEYAVDSFELYFFDEDGAIQNEIIKCRKKESCEKAKDFLIEHCQLKFVSLY